MNRGRTRRARLKRSKTGCRTCRARHVKCDETPGKCQNCTSTGRQCDGYDTHRLPLPNKQTRHSERLALSPPVAVTVPWASTSDERRCFGFVQARTIPDVLSYFDSLIWEQFALQMVRREPAVWHAVVALGAVHQHIEPRLMGGSTVWECIAVAQSTRSFACLRRRNPQDPQMREVTLLCCLLFTIMDVVRQEFGTAVQHIRAGLRILDEAQLSTSRDGQPLLRFWLHSFRHLDTQISSDRLLMVEGSGSRSSTEDAGNAAVQPAVDPTWLSWTSHSQEPYTVASARHMLEPLYNRFFKFIRQCWRMSPAELQSAAAAPVLAEQASLTTQYHRARQFWRIFRTEQDASKLSPKDERGAEVLEIWLTTVGLGLQTGPLHGDPTALQRFTPQYRDLLNRNQRFLARFPQRPTLLVDMGVLPTIFFVGDGCQDLSVRWEALQAHYAWPHQEGPFSAPLMAARLEHLIRTQLRVRVRADLVASLRLTSHQPAQLMTESEVESCLEEVEELVETETDRILEQMRSVSSCANEEDRERSAHMLSALDRMHDHWGSVARMKRIEGSS
ncbi:hypothetical protein BO99DRAFT_379613 [Aspergillus violaceofuscus CBS 115571]|uniref:Zn(2)-C6 fungal-type domain-containing protein n=1 Tax=Aspergillus violaceofuscus (strain CBS 115571) TaxID=1450538 RepID=A0A2V5HJP4_ASPV1|nr:hypothetical protein BO99DRAFT_379613 [Aspergillus violaceofuscus CBS 115571]